LRNHPALHYQTKRASFSSFSFPALPLLSLLFLPLLIYPHTFHFHFERRREKDRQCREGLKPVVAGWCSDTFNSSLLDNALTLRFVGGKKGNVFVGRELKASLHPIWEKNDTVMWWDCSLCRTECGAIKELLCSGLPYNGGGCRESPEEKYGSSSRRTRGTQ